MKYICLKYGVSFYFKLGKDPYYLNICQQIAKLTTTP